jgi:hypothetical protein
MDHQSQPNEKKPGKRKQYCQFVQQANGIISVVRLWQRFAAVT